MTSMVSFGMDIGSYEMSNMDMAADHDMADMQASDSDCDENHCNKCFHVGSFILTTAVFIDKQQHQQFAVPVKGYFSSFVVPLDSPPPIFS